MPKNPLTIVPDKKPGHLRISRRVKILAGWHYNREGTIVDIEYGSYVVQVDGVGKSITLWPQEVLLLAGEGHREGH